MPQMGLLPTVEWPNGRGSAPPPATHTLCEQRDLIALVAAARWAPAPPAPPGPPGPPDPPDPPDPRTPSQPLPNPPAVPGIPWQHRPAGWAGTALTPRQE